VPDDARYLILTFLMLLVPLVTAVVLIRRRAIAPGPGRDDAGSLTVRLTNHATVLINLLLVGASCAAAVAQYPYPEGNGVIPFAVLAVCAPTLSLMALFDGKRRVPWEERRSPVGR
jgi:hypothetical protein